MVFAFVKSSYLSPVNIPKVTLFFALFWHIFSFFFMLKALKKNKTKQFSRLLWTTKGPCTGAVLVKVWSPGAPPTRWPFQEKLGGDSYAATGCLGPVPITPRILGRWDLPGDGKVDTAPEPGSLDRELCPHACHQGGSWSWNPGRTGSRGGYICCH